LLATGNNANASLSIHTSSCAGPQVGINRSTDIASSGDTDNVSVSFVDAPGTTSPVDYYFCGSAAGSDITAGDRTLVAQLVSAGADLAEVYYSNETLEPGDVVALDPSVDGNVRRTTAAYDTHAIGVISTRPGLLLSEAAKAGGEPVMVALSGRIPVKVTTANGSIVAGDYLTASDIPGVAMKATRSGIVIGQALSGFDGEGVGEVMAFVKNMHGTGADIASLDAQNQQFTAGLSVTGTGLVANFVNASGASIGTITGDSFSVTTATIGTLTVSQINSPALDVIASSTEALNAQLAVQLGFIQQVTSTLADVEQRLATIEDLVGPLQAFSATDTTSTITGLTFDDAGDVLFNQLVSFRSGIRLDEISPIGDLLSITGDVQFLGRAYFDKDTGGFAVVHEGQRVVHIAFDRAYLQKPVISANVAFDDPTFTTSTMDQYFDQDFRIVVLNASTTGFDILFNKPVSRDVTLSWTAIAVKDANIFHSALTIDSTAGETVIVPAPVVPVGIGNASSTTSVTDDSVSTTGSGVGVDPPPVTTGDEPPAETPDTSTETVTETPTETTDTGTTDTPSDTAPVPEEASTPAPEPAPAPAPEPAPAPAPEPAPAPSTTDSP
jgi:hypothetical protein